MRIKEQYKNQTIGTKLSIGVMINVNTADYTDAQLEYYKQVGLDFLLEDEPVETIEEEQPIQPEEEETIEPEEKI
jgi:hypothetical protein